MDVLSTLGTPRQTITRTMSAGEVWSASSAAILRIYATGTAVTAGGMVWLGCWAFCCALRLIVY